MPGLAARLCWGRAIGIYLQEDRITVTEVATTPAGTSVQATYDREIDENGPGETLKAMLSERLTPRRRRHVPVCLGVRAEQTFFATRPIQREESQKMPSLDDMLAMSGGGSAWEGGQAVGDYVRFAKVKAMGDQVYSVAACPRNLAEDLFRGLQDAGVENCRLEPGPWSLVAAADRQGRSPKKWKFSVRVLLGEAGGLAILVAEGQPLLWRRFTVAAGDPPLAIGSAVRSVLVHAVTQLGVRSVAGAVLQGPSAEAMREQVAGDLGMEVAAVDGEGLTNALCSHALALSAKKDAPESLNLFRSLRPPPSIRDMFPWKLAVLVLCLGAGMALTLWDKSSALAREHQDLRHQNASHTWARKLSTSAVNKERKALRLEVGAVHRFLSTRVIWTDYLRDLPTRLPPNAYLSNVWATCEMKSMSKKKIKRKTSQSLTLRGVTRFVNRGAAPKEIDAFLESLRNVELLQRDFPLVQLAEIKWRREGESEVALFTIIALPKSGKGSK